MRALLVALLATAAVACSSSGQTDISGLYMVTLSTANTMGCGNETTAPGAPLYFLLKKDSLLGQEFFDVYTCPTMDQSTCVSGDGLYVTSGADGWHGFVSLASGDTSDCELGYIDYAALYDPTPTTLRLETHTYEQNGAIEACTTAEAEQLSTNMPCISSSILVGTLVQ